MVGNRLHRAPLPRHRRSPGASGNRLPYAERVEPGPWFAAGEPLDAAAVVARMRHEVEQGAGVPRPYAVYVHVPFCKTICSFCALYTSALGKNADRRLDSYLEAVLESLESNPWCHRSVGPTTIHFGGGTPLVLGLERFERLVRGLITAFDATDACELAIETTTSSLDPATVDRLEDLGIRRVHLGIQTLNDGVRSKIGRRETGEEAVRRILSLEARGFFTSVDLILGLDGVDEAVVRADLGRLHAAGVRMFSICELRDPRRHKFLENQTDKSRNERHFAIWQVIWRFMERAGLVPIHIGQFARCQAENLYFTHPARGEDCVAIGPYSHGSTGHLSYANLLLPDFHAAVRAGLVPVSMGVDYGAGERAVCALERELLTHRVSQAAVSRWQAEFSGLADEILDWWLRSDLLKPGHHHGEFLVTAGGSWFIGNMIADIRSLAESNGRIRPSGNEAA